jgi:hypothetical protein
MKLLLALCRTPSLEERRNLRDRTARKFRGIKWAQFRRKKLLAPGVRIAALYSDPVDGVPPVWRQYRPPIP